MNDLLVVGAGHLGARVAVLWKEKFPESKIFLKTKSDNAERTEKWRSLGFEPFACSGSLDSIPKCPYVVYSVPPTSDDAATTYASDIENSIVEHLTPDGVFVFTSSGGVYTENDGNVVDENSPVATSGRNKTILDGESKVLAYKNGIVLRFGGLYTSTRGAHNFWLKSGKPEFPSAPNGVINLIHYDDAALCVTSALLSLRLSERLFLVSDGIPISRKDICLAALKNPAYSGLSCPEFTGDAGLIDGKRYNVSRVKNSLNWKPEFESFAVFMEEKYNLEKEISLLQ